MEVDKSLRQNPVAEERHTALDEGHNYRDSIGRKISKYVLPEYAEIINVWMILGSHRMVGSRVRRPLCWLLLSIRQVWQACIKHQSLQQCLKLYECRPLLHEDSDSKSSRPHGILPNNRVKPED